MFYFLSIQPAELAISGQCSAEGPYEEKRTAGVISVRLGGASAVEEATLAK
jgi:hypothetical protein